MPDYENRWLSTPFICYPGVHPVYDFHELADMKAFGDKPGREITHLVI